MANCIDLCQGLFPMQNGYLMIYVPLGHHAHWCWSIGFYLNKKSVVPNDGFVSGVKSTVYENMNMALLMYFFYQYPKKSGVFKSLNRH